jgi:hypothetical protein
MIDGRGGEMRNRISTVVATVLAVTIAATALGGAKADAHHEPLIQPGAPVYGGGNFGGQLLNQPCTLNFVFRDARHTYIGMAARCSLGVGERVTTANREFGTVVFHAITLVNLEDSMTHASSVDDFALVRIDPSELHRVSPVVLDTGRAPHGIATSEEVAPGDMMFLTAQDTVFGRTPARHRAGVLTSHDVQGFHIAVPASFGIGGAPVLTNRYDAYGVMSSAAHVNGPYGMTIERVLHLLEEAGVRVELVTAYDEVVRRGR